MNAERYGIPDDWKAMRPLPSGKEGDGGGTVGDNRWFIEARAVVAGRRRPGDCPKYFGKWKSMGITGNGGQAPIFTKT